MMRLQYVLAMILAVTCAVGVNAQETTTGSIAGRVTDAQNLPIPGATVTVISPQGNRTFTTDTEGRFFAPFLTPGQYEVKVELSGFNPVDRPGIDVRSGQRVDLTLPLQVQTVTESVQVKAESPVIDTTSTTIGATLDADLLSRVPVGRRFSDALYLAPGVSSGGQVGQANPSIAGGSGLENAYVVDGVNITNGAYGALGSYSIVFGSLGNGLPFDFIQQAQVKTGGYQAEFGQASGGVVNVITKSGTNRLAGSVFGYFRPDGLESSYDQVQTTNGTVNITGTRQEDVGGEFGAPIVPNKLFVFAAVDPESTRTSYIAPNGFPLQSLGSVPQDRHITPYAAKATWQMNSQQRLDVSFFGDPAHGDVGPQRYTALLNPDTAAFSRLDKYGGNNQTAEVRRRDRKEMAGRGIVRARRERSRRSAVRGSMGRHRYDGDSASAIRRAWFLRGRKRQHELSVRREGDLRDDRPSDPLRSAGGAPGLREHVQPNRADLHAAEWRSDRHRRRDPHPAG